MTLFPELKEDFTAENGVTYTWEENRWRTKSFLTADGSVVEVGPIPPNDPSEGGLWYDSTRLELFVFYTDPDGVGGWVPCSPLGARVEAGELVQAQLVQRVGELEKRDPEDYLAKGTSNDVTTGFRIKCNNSTFLSAGGGELGLYNLKEPSDVSHAATKGYCDSVAAERLYTSRDLGEAAAIYQKKITYSTQDGGQLTIPTVPLSGPPIGNGDNYFSFKSWTGQFSLAVETEPGTWRTILLGVTSEIRYSTTNTSPFWEVRIPESGLIVNVPLTQYNDLNCKLKIAGLF